MNLTLLFISIINTTLLIIINKEQKTLKKHIDNIKDIRTEDTPKPKDKRRAGTRQEIVIHSDKYDYENNNED